MKPSSSARPSSVGYPKGPSQKQLREKRRRDLKRKDQDFQKNLAPWQKCIVGRECVGKVVKHHRLSRRFPETRHDDRIAAYLCIAHHTAWESMGHKRFYDLYPWV